MHRQNANFIERLEDHRRSYITAIMHFRRKRGIGVLYTGAFYLLVALVILFGVFLLIQAVTRKLPLSIFVLWLFPVGLAMYTTSVLSLKEDSSLTNEINSRAVTYVSADGPNYARELATNNRLLIYLVETNAFREVKPFTDSGDVVARYMLFREHKCQYLVINQQNFRPQEAEKVQVDIPVFGGLRIEGEIVDRSIQYPGPYVTDSEEQHLVFDIMENITKYLEGVDIVNRQLGAYLLSQMRLDKIEECISLPVRSVSEKLQEVDLENREQVIQIIGAVQQRITVANIRTDLLHEIQRQFFDKQNGYTVLVPYGLLLYQISFNNASEVYLINEANVNQMISSTQQTLQEIMALMSGKLALASATSEAQTLFQSVLTQNIFNPRMEDILGEETSPRKAEAPEPKKLPEQREQQTIPTTPQAEPMHMTWHTQEMPWERSVWSQAESHREPRSIPVQSVRSYVLSGRYLVRGMQCPPETVLAVFLRDMKNHFNKTEEELDQSSFKHWLSLVPEVQML